MENGINRISVYGDSILKGAVTGTDSGHLFDILQDNSLSLAQKTLGFELNNQSVFGNIITKSKRKLERDIEKGIVGDLAILESGGNDCDYDWAEVVKSPENYHEPRVPLNDFLRIFEEMVNACRSNKITPVIMSMPALVQDFWNEHIQKNYGKTEVLEFTQNDPAALYHNHEIYNTHLLKLAEKLSVQLVDMRIELLETKKSRMLMCKDGIHPNEDGHRFMASVWEKELPKIKKEF